MKQIELGEITDFNWIEEGAKMALNSNLICLTKEEFEKDDYSPLQWFGTNVIQKIATNGKTEICPLFGEGFINYKRYSHTNMRIPII
ncbi:MAG: hypothetical protein P1U56_22650 [Saprospiraceae bacterium]|nr:hypothetical protein [Saprospiraceae bacterium]